MIDAPFALAFTAGLVATVNPCGFAMLPAYMSWFLGLSDEPGPRDGATAVRRALAIGAVVSGGFLLVFGVVGLLVTLGLRVVIDLVPIAALVIGVLVAVLGVAMLLGFQPAIRLPSIGRARTGRRYSAVFSFGVAYAIASLSCTLPIFLAVVAGSVSRTNVLSGLLLFLVYGVGMSLVLVVVTLTLALGRQGLVRWMRQSSRSIGRVSGAILLVAGSYIVWFWATNLDDPLGASGPVVTVELWSSRVTQLIGDRPMLWGGVLGAITLVAVAAALVTRGRSTSS